MSCSLMIKEIKIGTVLELFLSRKNSSNRSPQEEIKVDKNGVLGDKFYAKEPNRSVLITSLKSYNLAKQKDILVKYGFLGENMLVDYNLYSLNIGTQIRVGEVVLEISQNCTLCKSLTKVDNRLPKLLKDDRGVFAKVIKSGSIYQHDEVFVMYVKYEKIDQ